MAFMNNPQDDVDWFIMQDRMDERFQYPVDATITVLNNHRLESERLRVQFLTIFPRMLERFAAAETFARSG